MFDLVTSVVHVKRPEKTYYKTYNTKRKLMICGFAFTLHYQTIEVIFLYTVNQAWLLLWSFGSINFVEPITEITYVLPYIVIYKVTTVFYITEWL